MYLNQNHKTIKIGPFSTSRIELRDLLKAWAAISLAFAILFRGTAGFAIGFLVSALTVGLGFLFHEIGHKLVAQRYGCFAEFRSDDKMLLIAILLSFIGFIIAAPGAVMISGPVGKNRNGKISATGPAVNLGLALIFLLLMLVFGRNIISIYGLRINSLLAAFNLIPFGIFDGRKVLEWSKPVYFALLVSGIILLVAGMLL